MEQYNGYVMASTWIQGGPAEGVNGPFAQLGDRSNLGSNDSEHAAWNRDIDAIHPDAGILWWMEFVKENFGPWRLPLVEGAKKETGKDPLGPGFDRRLKLEFHGNSAATDAVLQAKREFDEAFSLSLSINRQMEKNRPKW